MPKQPAEWRKSRYRLCRKLAKEIVSIVVGASFGEFRDIDDITESVCQHLNTHLPLAYEEADAVFDEEEHPRRQPYGPPRPNQFDRLANALDLERSIPLTQLIEAAIERLECARKKSTEA